MADPSVTPTSTALWKANTGVSTAQIDGFCRRWGLLELSLFGSVMRPDFSSTSDVDVMIKLDPERDYGPWDWLEMIDQLQALFGRKVDLTAQRILENAFRRQTILRDLQLVIPAAESVIDESGITASGSFKDFR